MSLSPPTNFNVVTIEGQKTFTFNRNLDADESIFEIKNGGNWDHLGQTVGNSFSVSNSITGSQVVRGSSQKDGNAGPPNEETVSF